jgi:hypothetical protein
MCESIIAGAQALSKAFREYAAELAALAPNAILAVGTSTMALGLEVRRRCSPAPTR